MHFKEFEHKARLGPSPTKRRESIDSIEEKIYLMVRRFVVFVNPADSVLRPRAFRRDLRTRTAAIVTAASTACNCFDVQV
jgi:hypothetical protein